MPNLSPGQIAVIRQMVLDPGFRQSFTADPAKTVAASGFAVSAAEMQPLASISDSQIAGMQLLIKELPNPQLKSSHTILYAIALAVAFALL